MLPSLKDVRLTKHCLSNRYSIGYFVGANYDGQMKILLASDGEQRKHEDTTYVEWRKSRVKTALRQLKGK